MNGGNVILAIVLLIGVVGIYFVPTIVANMQKHKNVVAIAALNLLLGWTVIGWVGALVWALIDSPSTPTRSAETVYAQFKTKDANLAWQRLSVGQPVKVVEASTDGSTWTIVTEDGSIGEITGEKAHQIKFRCEAVGPPRARVTGVWRDRREGTIANVAVTFS